MFQLPVGMGYNTDLDRDSDYSAPDPHAPFYDVIHSIFDKSGKKKEGPLPGTIPCEVKQSSTKFVFIFDLPGILLEDVKVESQKSMLLSVEAAKPTEKSRLFKKDEIVVEKFARRFLLPRDAKPDEASAKFSNGTLVVTVPRMPVSEKLPEEVKIEVQDGELHKAGDTCPCCSVGSTSFKSMSINSSESASVIDVPAKLGS